MVRHVSHTPTGVMSNIGMTSESKSPSSIVGCYGKLAARYGIRRGDDYELAGLLSVTWKDEASWVPSSDQIFRKIFIDT